MGASGRTLLKILTRTLIIAFILTVTVSSIIITQSRIKAAQAAMAEAAALSLLEEPEPIEQPEEISNDIFIPGRKSISYNIADGTCDFDFTNPQENNCYLCVSITRNDTSETLYTSPLISPGNSIGDVILFPEINAPGTYDAMLKVDAYEIEKLSFINSLVTETTINAR